MLSTKEQIEELYAQMLEHPNSKIRIQLRQRSSLIELEIQDVKFEGETEDIVVEVAVE